MGQNTRDIKVWAALAAVYVVWGSTYLGIRLTIDTIPPMLSGGLRFIAAALILGTVLAIRNGPATLRMTGREFCGAGLVGLLLLTGGNGMVAIAEQHISSGLAALLVASVPLWLVVFRVLARDRPHLLSLTGVLIGFCGVAGLSLTGGGSSSPLSIVIILIGSLSWSAGSFLSGRLPMPKDPFVASTVEMAVGGAGLLVAGTAFGERMHLGTVSTSSWLALAYLVLVGSLVGFTSYIWLLGNAPISLVSTYAYVNPVVAVLLGVLVLDERVTGQMVGAGLIIVVGVALVVSTERHGRRPETRAPSGETQLSRT
ncbi:EamA family transporter [Sphaerisporangium perillae]|uniref:EamA family transporter n=1 Tax=Sphaerisporangium perillae TaxID=2935860 RepID=UPI00200CD009|nr:EamA family transporter [Sphaerisporangium perillae]